MQRHLRPARSLALTFAILSAAFSTSAYAPGAVAQTAVAQTAVAPTSVAQTAVVQTAVAQTAVAPTAVAPTAVAPTPVAGAWLMRYERMVNSGTLHSTTTDAVEVVQGRLTLRQSGDSVFGEWQPMVAKGDTAPPPRSVHGVQRRDSVLLRFVPVVDNDAGMIATAAHEVVEFIKTYVHDMPPTTTALEVALRGDMLTGTRRTVLLDGTPRGQPQVLTGVRAKP